MIYRPVKVSITDDMIARSRERDQGKYNDKSFMDGAGNFVGFLGEEITHKVRPDLEFVNSFDYDFKLKNQTVDAKTKHQSVPKTPKEYYEVSICKDSLHQQVDLYVFCRIYVDKEKYPYGWVLGGISKKEYFEKARFLKKGERDGDNGYIVRQDCWNLRLDQLYPIKTNYSED